MGESTFEKVSRMKGTDLIVIVNVNGICIRSMHG